MKIGRLEIEWVWKTKWIEPRYGLDAEDYSIGEELWHDGEECVVVKIGNKRMKIRVRRENK